MLKPNNQSQALMSDYLQGDQLFHQHLGGLIKHGEPATINTLGHVCLHAHEHASPALAGTPGILGQQGRLDVGRHDPGDVPLPRCHQVLALGHQV